MSKPRDGRFQKGHKGYPGSLNPMWKGDKAGYISIHIWLKDNYGKPSVCPSNRKVKNDNN